VLARAIGWDHPRRVKQEWFCRASVGTWQTAIVKARIRGGNVAIDRSTLGPVEILAVAFPGNQFKGEIVPALRELVDDGVIRILDLTFVKKELDGTVTALEVGELEGDETDSYASLGPAEEEFINDEDLADVADELEAGSSAALLVWEDRWAAKLAAAIRDAKGEVLALERVPREAVDEVLDALGAG